jgi:hypothetical protein
VLQTYFSSLLIKNGGISLGYTLNYGSGQEHILQFLPKYYSMKWRQVQSIGENLSLWPKTKENTG